MIVLLSVLIFLELAILTKSIIFLIPVILIVLLIIISIISGETDYTCNIDDCNKSFKSIKELINHISEDHSKKDNEL